MAEIREFWKLMEKLFVVEGLLREFTALKIVKAYANFLYSKKFIEQFKFSFRPIVVTSAYHLINKFEREGLIEATKKGSNVSPTSKFKIKDKNRLLDLKEEIEKEIAKIHPNLISDLRRYIDIVSNLSDKEIEKDVDDKYNKLVECTNSKPSYVHPAIVKHINKLITIERENLEKLFDELKNIKEGELRVGVDSESRHEFISRTLKGWLKSHQRSGRVKMTDTLSSELKNGACEFVCNYRFLEFLRNRDGKVRIFKKDNKKYIVAIGKSYARNWHPAWAELYVFVVNRLEDVVEEITKELESHLVLVLAERFKIPEDWKKDIFNLSVNTWYKKISEEDFIGFFKEIGEFGGEVYLAYSVQLEEWRHKPMESTDARIYLKQMITRLQNDFPLLDTSFIRKNGLHFDPDQYGSLRDFLNTLCEKILELRSDRNCEDFEIERPISLIQAIEKGCFDCESRSLLILYHLIKYGYKYNVNKIKIIYVPLDLLRGLLYEIEKTLEDRSIARDKMAVLEYYKSILNNDHIVIIVEWEENGKMRKNS